MHWLDIVVPTDGVSLLIERLFQPAWECRSITSMTGGGHRPFRLLPSTGIVPLGATFEYGSVRLHVRASEDPKEKTVT